MMPPPRLARALVDRLVAPHLRDAVAGDLDELYAAESARHPRHATLRYWARALGAVWHLSCGPFRPVAPTPIGASTMGTIWTDLTHGLRLFVTQPAYAWAAVVTLALAIGANTVIFSIVNVLVLKPLPLEAPERLGWILVSGPNAAQDRAGTSLPEYAAYRAGVPAFEQLAAWRRRAAVMRIDDQAERVVAQLVIGDLQGLWGVRMAYGRRLSLDDERPEATRVAVLSHRYWTRRFGMAAAVLNRDVFVDGQRHQVVGVAGPEIELGNLSEIDVWVPVTTDPATAPRTERGWRPVGRIGAGATISDAHAQVTIVAAGLARDFPETSRDWTARVGTTRDALGGASTWLVLSLLSAVVSLLLVLACANVINLLIARLIGRRQELAVRTALGATRGRVARQIVCESVVLGLAGGLLGLAVAAAGLRGVHAVATEPFFDQIGFDWRVVTFALGLSFLAPLVFAIVPTFQLLGSDVRTSLNDATARAVGGATAGRGRAALVLLQVALAVMLLVVSGLVVQSMRALVDADLGYDPSPLLTAEIDVPAWHVPDDQAALRLRHQVVERVRALPGVQAAALTTAVPALHFPASTAFEIGGRDAVTERDRPTAGLTVTSPDYFTTLGIAMLAGRGFVAGDTAGAATVVVSAEAARRFWGNPTAAVGARVRLPGGDGRPALDATVIGVARDTVSADFETVREPVLFVLDDHRPVRSTRLVVRSSAPAALAPAVRAALRAIDPDLPAHELQTVSEGFANENSSNTLLSAMFASFALVALLLATAGLYGVISYAVSQRTPEIAVRMALGASRREIARDVVGGSLRLAAIGTAAGLVGAFALAQTMTSLLFGVTATDAPTYLGAAAVAVTAALVATWLPMRRAAGVDPLQSLRQA